MPAKSDKKYFKLMFGESDLYVVAVSAKRGQHGEKSRESRELDIKYFERNVQRDLDNCI